MSSYKLALSLPVRQSASDCGAPYRTGVIAASNVTHNICHGPMVHVVDLASGATAVSASPARIFSLSTDSGPNGVHTVNVRVPAVVGYV